MSMLLVLRASKCWFVRLRVPVLWAGKEASDPTSFSRAHPNDNDNDNNNHNHTGYEYCIICDMLLLVCVRNLNKKNKCSMFS